MADGFDIVSFLMGKQAGGGGGGGDITVESKSISANGTYTAPAGKAYSPVTVSVPNSYAAGDEGKVVSNGALVAQGSDTATQNGTVDTTLINSLLVNVSGGGGYGYTKLAEQDFTVNTSSTAETIVGTIPVSNPMPHAMLCVCVKDKAGKRNGYFFESIRMRVSGYHLTNCVYAVENSGTVLESTGTNGVYLSGYTNGAVVISSKYNSSFSKTIDGTYHVEVYALDWPDGVSPFATS